MTSKPISVVLLMLALALTACDDPDPVDAGADAAMVDSGGDDAGTDDAGPDAGPAGEGVLGDPCSDGVDCRSGICFPTGFGMGVCTTECADATDCVGGWGCDDFGGRLTCTCEASGESCNAEDDDCDAIVDEGEAATIGCGEGELCSGGACTCPIERMCDMRCVDIETDPAHCGACDAACPMDERCSAGSCCTPSLEVCNLMDDDCDGRIDEGDGSIIGCGVGESCTAGVCVCDSSSTCGGACVDILSDRNHCGACDNACMTGLDCVDGGCCEGSGTRVDVLFMIDNSNSMTEEQASLLAELPRMVRVLATGDLDGDGTPETEPVRDLHLGVVTSDMGTGGFTIPTCSSSSFGDDGRLRTQGNTALTGCMATYPAFLSFVPGSGDPMAAANDFSCVAGAGIGGCGFEQQLEAVLKASTPSTAPTRFFMATTGHADGANTGFIRPDSVLVMFQLTDENDCSALDPDLFNPSSVRYAGDLNLRCFENPSALHPLTRYIDGALATRSDPRDLIYAAVVGVPVDLVPTGTATPDFSRILSDPRMVESIDPMMPTRLVPSCAVIDRGFAFPPRRLVRVVQEIDRRGGTGIIGSICQADLSDPMDAVLTRISSRLSESCSAP